MLRVLLYAVVLFNSLSALRAEFSSSADDAFIRDDSNRVRFFHGVNMVHKSFPWYSDVLLDTDNIKDLQKWGLNALRLGVMWTGTEPNKGEYNETYLDIVTGIIDNLQSHGVHVLIDVHQDVLSSYFCEYDGAPTWLVDMSTSSEHEFPWPLPGTCSDRPWGSNYLAEATGAAFQDIYDNNNGMMDHFAAFWRKVADTFKGKDLLGYEIINEPWAGNIYSNPSLLLPGVAGSINLQPMYDTISSAIRSVDEAHLIFYEPVTWGMIFNGTVSGSGFSHVPGGDTYTRKSVLSFHYYCWWYDSTGAFDRVTCDAMFGPKVFDQCREDVSQLGGSYMLTEWGQGCDPTTPEGSLECNAVMDLADSHLTSWIDWYWGEHLEGSGFDATDEAVAVFSRTYAQAVAGTPTRMRFDTTDASFELCFVLDTGINTPTEVYVNTEIHYPDGVMVSIFGADAALLDSSVDIHDNLVKVFIKSEVRDDRNEYVFVSSGENTCVHIVNKRSPN